MHALVDTTAQHDAILRLQAHMMERPQLSVESLTSHHFADGVYMRELLIPAGHVCVGKTHRFEHLNILLSGTIEVATDEGSKRITGPQVIKSPAGIKRAGYAITDTVWLTVHGNPDNEQNMHALESRYITPDVPALEMAHNKLTGGA